MPLSPANLAIVGDEFAFTIDCHQDIGNRFLAITVYCVACNILCVLVKMLWKDAELTMLMTRGGGTHVLGEVLLDV